MISPRETGILYSQRVLHSRTRLEQGYVAHQENDPNNELVRLAGFFSILLKEGNP